MWPVALVGAGVALALNSNRGPQNTTTQKSTIDNRVYKVQNLPDKQDAANMLATVRGNITTLIQKYRDTRSDSDPRVQALISRFNPENMVENDVSADSTSYSENKGEKIVVCVRDKAPPYSIVDANTVMFVVLHEMAHLMTTTIGHTPEFWANFRRILHDAVGCAIYTPVNYSRTPTPYCGMTITDSPI